MEPSRIGQCNLPSITRDKIFHAKANRNSNVQQIEGAYSKSRRVSVTEFVGYRKGVRPIKRRFDEISGSNVAGNLL